MGCLQGQYGRVMGYIEPLDPEDVDPEAPEKVVFANEVFGNAIPPSFLPACEKGFREACNAGSLISHPVEVSLSHQQTRVLICLLLGAEFGLLDGYQQACNAGSLISHPVEVSSMRAATTPGLGSALFSGAVFEGLGFRV